MRNFIESLMFSWTPTFFAFRPSAMPSSWVKYRILISTCFTQRLFGPNLVHLETGVAGRAFGRDDVGAGQFRRLQDIEHQLGRHIAVGQRMRAATAGRLQREIDVLGAGRGQQVVHEMRLGRRLTARSLIFLGEDMARPRVHAAVVVGDLDAATANS